MYISGGSNLYPRENEEKMLKHLAISEAAVLGVADRTWGAIGVVVVVLMPGPALDAAAFIDWLG